MKTLIWSGTRTLKDPRTNHAKRGRHGLQFLAVAAGTAAVVVVVGVITIPAQTPDNPQGGPSSGDFRPFEGGPGFGGPPFGPGGFGPGGPGGGKDLEVLKQFDKDRNGWLNAAERKEAREYVLKQGANRGPRGPGRRGGGFGGFGESQGEIKPGLKISPSDVKTFPDAPLYASNVLRTLFLEFESTDWEKELETFHGTDVDVPAKLNVDGKAYSEVGVRFRGMSSYMMVGTGRKRSLNLSVDLAHENQNVMGFRTLNLLNSHEDPTFLRTVLSLQVARDYLPSPRANLVRVVINGEDWGIYVNVEQFNKDFVKDRFGSSKGVRFKVPGHPGGQGGLEYLGENVSAYKQIYEIKSKDDAKSWAGLIGLCKVLTETPAEQLESALSPILDIDGVLRFLAWDNVMVNGDGFWTRASDYDLYQDEKGRFHVIPYDANETFNTGGGPGGPGGPGRPGGMGGAGGFGPGMFLAPQLMAQADKNSDQKISSSEFAALAETWYSKIDIDKEGALTQELFTTGLAQLLPSPQGRDGFGPPGVGRGGFGPGMILGPAVFTAADINKDDVLTRAELKELFAKWFAQWDSVKAGEISEEAVREGLNQSLPRPEFGGPGGFAGGGRRRGGGPGGPGFGGFGAGGPNLDPLAAANDPSKPLISKLLAVPSLRARYLGYVRDMAEKWLDWKRIGPVATEYHQLIEDVVKADTRKLDTFDEFQAGLDGTSGRRGSLKSFVEQRRSFLLNHAGVKAASPQ